MSMSNMAMMVGKLGREGCGVNPLRGQNNVQGACDMGALPDTYPGYQYVKDPANREKFAKAWGVESLPAHTGYRISELPHRAAHGEVRAAYIMGEDPLQTDAELSAVRKAFDDLELVIVQDIFMTKTASAADVILPSTSWGEHEGVYTAADRGFQRFFKAVEPKWDLKTDWQIISEIARKAGLPLEKTPSATFSRYGTLSSASIPAALCDLFGEDGSTGHRKIMLCGYGIGLTWASCLWEPKNCACTPVQSVPAPDSDYASPEAQVEYWRRYIQGERDAT